jgi:hypothetical protein
MMAKEWIVRLMDFRVGKAVDKHAFALRMMYLPEGFDSNSCYASILERRSLLGGPFLSPELFIDKHPMIEMFHHTVSES